MDWIKACISSPWIDPLVNGRPNSFFQASRGLRQGFPLSPLLYIIMVEIQRRNLEKERLKGRLIGLKIARNVKLLNHSQFVNDTLLLGGASKVVVGLFKSVLDKYISLLGGFINKRKSQIYGWNYSDTHLCSISSLLEFPFSSTWNSFKYLGAQILLGNSSSGDWDEALHKFKKKINSLGARWLNLAGIIVLMKYVVSSLSIFQCSILLAPKGVAN